MYMLFYSWKEKKMFVAFRTEFNIKSSFLAATEKTPTNERKKKHVDKLFCVWESECLSVCLRNRIEYEAGKLRLSTLSDLAECVCVCSQYGANIQSRRCHEENFFSVCIDLRRLCTNFFFSLVCTVYFLHLMLFIQEHSLLYHHPISESIKIWKQKYFHNLIRKKKYMKEDAFWRFTGCCLKARQSWPLYFSHHEPWTRIDAHSLWYISASLSDFRWIGTNSEFFSPSSLHSNRFMSQCYIILFYTNADSFMMEWNSKNADFISSIFQSRFSSVGKYHMRITLCF